MSQHFWLTIAVILFVVAAILYAILPEPITRRYPQIFVCAGLACFVAGFLVI